MRIKPSGERARYALGPPPDILRNPVPDNTCRYQPLSSARQRLVGRQPSPIGLVRSAKAGVDSYALTHYRA